jgi:hypothetical protein
MADNRNESPHAGGTGVQHRPVDVRLESALVSLARSGLPAAPKELLLRDVVWGGSPTPEVSRIEVESDGSLYLRAQPRSKAAIVEDPTGWTPEHFKAEVDGHGPLAIAQGVSPIAQMSFGSTGSTITAALQGWRWSAVSGRTPLLWATRLEFMTSEPPMVLWRGHGNMVLAVDGNLVRGWRFDTGRGQAFLVPNDGDWYMAVEAGALRPPDAHLFHLFHLVRSVVGFVFGEPLNMGLVRPIGEGGCEPGLVHVDLGRHKERDATREPPAVPFECAPTWTARFVDALFRLGLDVPDVPLLGPLHLYFASRSGSLESKFLLAWVGVETVASWKIKSDKAADGGRLRLADHDAWLAWVEAHRAEIEALATLGCGDGLVSRVRESEYASPTAVQRVFRGLGLTWSPEMKDAEQVRHGVVHEGAMPGPHPDWERDRARVGLVTTMLTALLARVARYRGPLADRSKTCSNIAAKDEPTWWPAEQLSEHLDYRGAGVDEIAAANDERLRQLRAELSAHGDDESDDDGAT